MKQKWQPRALKIIPFIAKILDEMLYDLDKFFAANSYFTPLRYIQFFDLQIFNCPFYWV